MSVPGAWTSRSRIAQALNGAYASGLLSEDTFARRTDQLLGGGVIHPSRLIGDLSERSRPAWLSRVTTGAARLIERFATAPEPETADEIPLLALDWTGGDGALVIGRHPGCDVVLADLTVSRRHAQLLFRDGRWIARDLDSTNGIEVNGCRVGRCELRPGDLVTFGTQRFLVD